MQHSTLKAVVDLKKIISIISNPLKKFNLPQKKGQWNSPIKIGSNQVTTIQPKLNSVQSTTIQPKLNPDQSTTIQNSRQRKIRIFYSKWNSKTSNFPTQDYYKFWLLNCFSHQKKKLFRSINYCNSTQTKTRSSKPLV